VSPSNGAEPRTIEPWYEELQGADQTVLDAGEAVIVRTPIRGGYGKAK
jgi:5-oxoprolinase (ATP-hydrolysing)